VIFGKWNGMLHAWRWKLSSRVGCLENHERWRKWKHICDKKKRKYKRVGIKAVRRLIWKGWKRTGRTWWQATKQDMEMDTRSQYIWQQRNVQRCTQLIDIWLTATYSVFDRVTVDRHMYDNNSWTLHCSNWLCFACLLHLSGSNVTSRKNMHSTKS